MVESLGKGKRRPYHKQKLALVLANQRQFALEQARRGVAVRYILAANYDEALGQVVKDVGVIHCMEPAERELRQELAPFVERGELVMHPNRLWLTTAHDFEAACGSGQWRGLYRHVRKKFGVDRLDRQTDRRSAGAWTATTGNAGVVTRAPTSPPSRRMRSSRRSCRYGRASVIIGTVNTDRLPTTAADSLGVVQGELHDHLVLSKTLVRARTLFHTLVSSLVNNGGSPVRLINEVLPMRSRSTAKRGLCGRCSVGRGPRSEQSDGFAAAGRGRSATPMAP